MGFRVGIDIGGTFTDLTLICPSGQRLLWKEDSDRVNPEKPILAGLGALADQLDLSPAEFVAQIDVFVHGSTIATNALIERNSGPVGLICTRGFRDILLFRNGFKPDRFNVRLERPEDFAERRFRIGVTERIDARGNVVTPLNESDVRTAAAVFREGQVKSVAISLLWSPINPAHERRVAEILREELDVPIICSVDVLPEIREWERTSSTVLSAYIAPKIGEYLQRLKAELRRLGLRPEPLIMQITGGCASVDEILKRPVNTLASGPAAAPAAGGYYAAAHNEHNVIIMDMGGTSLDVSMILDGSPIFTREVEVEFQPIGVSAIDVQSIGAGGGSIAWIDDGGALRVGPRSAGAMPGPACYDNGGTEPTVTDTNVALGYIDPDDFLGGRRRLRADLSTRAIETRIAGHLGLSVELAAAGILQIVDSAMAEGIRAISVSRGLDPRKFLLVAGGGAGGLHAVRLARMLGMKRVLIPREASTFCSFGMTVADVRHDMTMAWHSHSSTLDVPALRRLYHDAKIEASARLVESGSDEADIYFEASADARYPGQIHELTVSFDLDGTPDDQIAEHISQLFHKRHRENFSYNFPDMPVEFLHWRLSAGIRPVLAVHEDRAGPTSTPALAASRSCYSWRAKGFIDHSIYKLADLAPGLKIAGPAIVTSPITTVLLEQGDTAEVSADMSLMIWVNGIHAVGVDPLPAAPEKITEAAN